MLLNCPLFHCSLLFSVELLALTSAIFLFLYIKKENFNRWYTFIAAAIIGLVVLTMAASFIGAICMHCKGEHREREEKRMMFHHEMGGMDMEEMGRHGGMMRIEKECTGDMEGCKGMEGCEKGGMEGCKNMGECGKTGMSGCGKTENCEMECCKGKKDGHCDMKEMKDGKPKMTKKDSIADKKKH
jgi:hypothetical protein